MNKYFFAVRGIGDKLFSEGMDELVDLARKRGWTAEVFNHWQGSKLLSRLKAITGSYKLVVAGHSMGVDTADDAVTAWGRRVDGFVSVDSAFPETLPENVDEVKSIVADHFNRFNVKGGKTVVNVVIDGTTHTTVDNAQELKDIVDELLARHEENKPMQKPFYIGEGRQISEQDIVRLATESGIPPYLALACAYKETPKLTGSWSSGALNALYEDHVAYRNTSGETRAALVRAKLAASGWRDLPYPASPYPAIDRCAEIAGTEVAARATSWGLFQILGENYRMLDFSSALDMVRWLAESEHNQFEGWVRTIDAMGVRSKLLAEDFAGYALVYNGPKYASHGYHTKLAELATFFKSKYGAGFPEPTLLPAPSDPVPAPHAHGTGSEQITINDLHELETSELAAFIGDATTRVSQTMEIIKAATAILESRAAAAMLATVKPIAATPASLGSAETRKDPEMKLGYIAKMLGALIGGGSFAALAHVILPEPLATPEFINALTVLFAALGTYYAPRNDYGEA